MTVETVRRGDERLGQGGVPADRVAAQAFSSFNSATVVTVARDTEVAEPIEIAVTGPGEGATAYGHLQVRVEELAEAVVVIDQRGSGTYADNIEFVVGDAARLTVVSIADWADDAVHVSAPPRRARQGRGAAARRGHPRRRRGAADRDACGSTRPAATPSCSACTSPTTASTSSRGCWSTTRSRTAGRTCRTRVRCKAIRTRDKPDAHTVWVGDVLIRAEATGTDTFETNRNLVLTDGARADSVPNLEIETGEIVGAGHASATGRFDDEQLFYLRPAASPKTRPAAWSCAASSASSSQKIAVPAVRERLTEAIEHELAITESRTATS